MKATGDNLSPTEINVPPINLNSLTFNTGNTIDIQIKDSNYQIAVRQRDIDSENALPQVLKDIRECESGNKNIKNARSSASGIFQIINGTWGNYEGYARAMDAPVYLQNRRALELYNASGTSPWNASIGCWGAETSGSNYGSFIVIGPDPYRNCVSYVKAKTGIYRSLGPGARYGINTQTASVGSIGSLKGRAHAVYITKIDGDMITFTESNYSRQGLTMRTLPRSYFLGFIV